MKDQTKIIITSYENGMFDNMMEQFNRLSKSEKISFIQYCDENGLQSVPLTILEEAIRNGKVYSKQ